MLQALYFDSPLLYRALQSRTVDLQLTPYACNRHGQVDYCEHVPSGCTLLSPPAPSTLQLGNPYAITDVVNTKRSPGFGIEREWRIDAQTLVYEPLWASAEAAQAFGMLLLAPGQAVAITTPEYPALPLQHMHYEYGVFAAHYHPYQGQGQRLNTEPCTDLEHHDFPHLLISCDPIQPLVVSVARYWPQQNRLRLADLWLPPGHALYVPAQIAPAADGSLYLHNNRLAARACWGNAHQNSILTQTLLREDPVNFSWYWNALPCVHPAPPARQP